MERQEKNEAGFKENTQVEKIAALRHLLGE